LSASFLYSILTEFKRPEVVTERKQNFQGCRHSNWLIGATATNDGSSDLHVYCRFPTVVEGFQLNASPAFLRTGRSCKFFTRHVVTEVIVNGFNDVLGTNAVNYIIDE